MNFSNDADSFNNLSILLPYFSNKFYCSANDSVFFFNLDVVLLLLLVDLVKLLWGLVYVSIGLDFCVYMFLISSISCSLLTTGGFFIMSLFFNGSYLNSDIVCMV